MKHIITTISKRMELLKDSWVDVLGSVSYEETSKKLKELETSFIMTETQKENQDRLLQRKINAWLDKEEETLGEQDRSARNINSLPI